MWLMRYVMRSSTAQTFQYDASSDRATKTKIEKKNTTHGRYRFILFVQIHKLNNSKKVTRIIIFVVVGGRFFKLLKLANFLISDMAKTDFFIRDSRKC